ncbi:MAG: HAMP domain-containing sensor histidine kinase [Acidobacteriota bacterium]
MSSPRSSAPGEGDSPRAVSSSGRGALGLGPSLFWTFAGAFLIVLVVAALVQGWGVVSLLGSIEKQQVVERAGRASDEAVTAIRELVAESPAAGSAGDGSGPSGRRFGRLLHELQSPKQDFWIVLVREDGRVDGGWHLRRESRRELLALLGVDAPPRFEGGPGDDGFRPRRRGENAASGSRGGPDRASSPRGGQEGSLGPRRGQDGAFGPRRGESRQRFGGPRGGQEGDSGNGPRRPNDDGLGPEPLPAEVELDLEKGDVEILVRRSVVHSGVPVGEVLALLPRSWVPRRPSVTPTGWLLSLPVALILAGGAGVLMLRHLLRRLRALEILAERVEGGDLKARVRVAKADEIGRLGLRLNRMTAALQEARGQLQDADEQRRRLLADVSHELATPLTSIRGYAETLLDPEVPVSEEEREEYLRDVLSEARRMNLLIQDLFELARLEGGVGGLDREILDWTALCRFTLERFRPRFEEAGLRLSWVGPESPAWVWADGRRLEQVLDNLLLNALRYVPRRGTVTLSLEAAVSPPAAAPGPPLSAITPTVGSGPPAATHGSAAELAVHRLELRDDGPGIAPSELPHIFDRFFRAASARSRSGSGLGLAIVREIVERHGGQVSAHRRDPLGTAFVVLLPAASEE